MIENFWAWWRNGGEAAVTAAIESGDPEATVPLLAPRVAEIGDGLSWELGPGIDTHHQLVVTGDSDKRAVARRWLNAAPAPDTTWSYADSRQRRPLGSFRLNIGSTVVHYADVVVAAQRRQNHLDVRVHHPSFCTLPERQRYEITFLALDHALGEAAVEQWLRGIETTVNRPNEAYSLAELVGLVDALALENTDEDGSPAWIGLQWDGENGRTVAATQVPLCSTQAPNLDTHITIAIPYLDVDDTGFPTEATWNALNALRNRLEADAAPAGRVLALETHAGQHIVHLYLDSSITDVSVLRDARTGWNQGVVSVFSRYDPRWSGVAHLRT